MKSSLQNKYSFHQIFIVILDEQIKKQLIDIFTKCISRRTYVYPANQEQFFEINCWMTRTKLKQFIICTLRHEIALTYFFLSLFSFVLFPFFFCLFLLFLLLWTWLKKITHHNIQVCRHFFQQFIRLFIWNSTVIYTENFFCNFC